MDNQNNDLGNSINNNGTVSYTEIGDMVKKKKANTPAIFFGIMMLLFAGAAVFFGVKYFEPKEEDSDEPIVIEQIEDETKIEIATNTMANDYKEVLSVVESLTKNIGEVWDNYKNSNSLMYKPVDFNTFIPMRLTIEKQITSSDSGDATVAVLRERLEAAGFESIGTLPNLGSAPAPDEYGYLDSSRNIVCSVREGAQSNLREYANLECAKTDWTWLTEDDKKLVSELETAYYEKEGNYPLELDIRVLREVKNSEYASYQTLTVGLKGSLGLFYRTSPDAKWQFFAMTQAPLECSEYNTDDLRKAFAGDVCYNGIENSVVQP